MLTRPSVFAGPETPNTGEPALKKGLKPSTLFKWVPAVLIIILFATSGLLVVASYLSVKVPLVSPSFQQKVDYWVASVPAIPKTSKQIITKASKDSENIKTAKQNFEFKLQNGSTSIGLLTVETHVDSTDLDNTSLEARIKGEFRLAPQVYELDLSLTQITKDVYFKIDKTPDALLAPYGYDLSKIRGKWYQMDAEEAGGEYRSERERG